MNSELQTAALKFDRARAAEYEQQSRIALAGYEACHELTACILAAALGSGSPAHLLVAGAGGTAQEIVTIARLEPQWRFTGVDPSAAMLELSRSRVEARGLSGRVDWKLGRVDDLPEQRCFDAATLLGVLHHLPGNEAKLATLRAIAARLKPAAPFVVACNHYAYASQPLFLAAWRQRWRQAGASNDEIEAKLGKILHGADPPASEEAVAGLLRAAGFSGPMRFFCSLFWGAWLTRLATPDHTAA